MRLGLAGGFLLRCLQVDSVKNVYNISHITGATFHPYTLVWHWDTPQKSIE